MAQAVVGRDASMSAAANAAGGRRPRRISTSETDGPPQTRAAFIAWLPLLLLAQTFLLVVNAVRSVLAPVGRGWVIRADQ